MYLDHVRRYVNIKELLAGSLHTNSGAEQLVILNTRNPLETHGPPSPSFLPDRSTLVARLGYNARQIDDSTEYQRIHRASRCNRLRAQDQFKRIMEIDRTSWTWRLINRADESAAKKCAGVNVTCDEIAKV